MCRWKVLHTRSMLSRDDDLLAHFNKLSHAKFILTDALFFSAAKYPVLQTPFYSTPQIAV